jgi:hypothetical protein
MSLPLHVELMDVANFFEEYSRGRVVFEAEAAACFAEELADMATRAKALETGAPADAQVSGPADIEPVDNDLSRAIGAAADFFMGYRDEKLVLTPAVSGEIEATLRRHQESARKLEAQFELWRLSHHEADVRVADLERRPAPKAAPGPRAVYAAILDGKVIDLNSARGARAHVLAPPGDTL